MSIDKQIAAHRDKAEEHAESAGGYMANARDRAERLSSTSAFGGASLGLVEAEIGLATAQRLAAIEKQLERIGDQLERQADIAADSR